MTSIGIHDLELSTAHHVVSLNDYAALHGVDPAKFHLGLGQDDFSFPAPDEDIVTMGAAAAARLLERTGSEGIRTLIFATESGVDQSKSAGIAAHRLLGLASQVRVVEFKQACYGATAALQAAIGIISRSPAERVLVISSDVARYELDSPGEPTQGAGAVAMLVTADPALLEIEPASGLFTADIDDFWRPNDSTTAVVDGVLSMDAYRDALVAAWDDYVAQGGVAIDEIDRIIYHQPFTKMAKKAQEHLAAHTGAELSVSMATHEPGAAAVAATGPRDTGLGSASVYNRRLGNLYTASLYSCLASLLDHDASLEGKRVALFSYGSGSVSEFFTGVVQPGYFESTRADHARRVAAEIEARVPLSLDDYRVLHATEHPSIVDYETPRVTTGPFRFVGTRNQARLYEQV